MARTRAKRKSNPKRKSVSKRRSKSRTKRSKRSQRSARRNPYVGHLYLGDWALPDKVFVAVHDAAGNKVTLLGVFSGLSKATKVADKIDKGIVEVYEIRWNGSDVVDISKDGTLHWRKTPVNGVEKREYKDGKYVEIPPLKTSEKKKSLMDKAMGAIADPGQYLKHLQNPQIMDLAKRFM